MTNKPYKEIDEKELCKVAYVGGTSFYRYFKDLDDVILYAFIRMWEDWCDTNNVAIRDKFTLDNAVAFFSYNLSIKDRLNLIYKNNLESVLLESFETLMKDDNNHNYDYAYGLFSMLKEWWIRDFKETPLELSIIIRRLIEKNF